MSASFIRREEDFVCENCGKIVKGNGYTNHCPYCLYSKHVDVNPGDRASDCGGLMEPISVEKRKNELILVHRCAKCGHQKRNKTAPNDDFDQLLKLMQKSGFLK